jgi:hypothetical protein
MKNCLFEAVLENIVRNCSCTPALFRSNEVLQVKLFMAGFLGFSGHWFPSLLKEVTFQII